MTALYERFTGAEIFLAIRLYEATPYYERSGVNWGGLPLDARAAFCESAQRAMIAEEIRASA